jgi:hypothetical protein
MSHIATRPGAATRSSRQGMRCKAERPASSACRVASQPGCPLPGVCINDTSTFAERHFWQALDRRANQVQSTDAALLAGNQRSIK